MDSSRVHPFTLRMAPNIAGSILLFAVTLQAACSCLHIAINLHYTKIRIPCTVPLVVLILICTSELHVVMTGPEIIPHPLQ